MAFIVASPVGPAQAAQTVDRSDMTITPVLRNLPMTPVAAKFAPDGRIYVAIKQGQVLMYDGPGDRTPVTTLDIRTDVNSSVNSYGDRGLLGLALDPAFSPGRPYIYVMYTYDRDPFGTNKTVPRWGGSCTSPPGSDGCTVTARVTRYAVDANGVVIGPPLVLLDGADNPLGGWCNQFSSHSIGTLAFGGDGMLYVGAGDGASYEYADFGHSGGKSSDPDGTFETPPNPCNDKQSTSATTQSGGRGTPLTATTSLGGAFRSQAVRGAINNAYVSWDGAILRVNPDTGFDATGNPMIGNGISGDDRIVAYGLRNPFRFSFAPDVGHPGTLSNQLWLGDVGYNTWEEVDSFETGAGQTDVPNFGWPCYEGPGREDSYASLHNNLCDSLYATNTPTMSAPSMLGTAAGHVVPSTLTPPVYTWARLGNSRQLPCGAAAVGGGGASVGGAFVTNQLWPTTLKGAYVFGDYARQCIAVMPIKNGQPDPTQVQPLLSGVFPVDSETGPEGDIYYIDIVAKTFNRIRPVVGNVPPVASFTVTPNSGPTPLDVHFDASATTDANSGDTLSYSWDLDGEGICDDVTGVTANKRYTVLGTVDAQLCVIDNHGGADSVDHQIQPQNSAPVIISLTTTAVTSGWAVGDTIGFVATATDDGGPLPNSAYTWNVNIRHCETETGSVCHTHSLGVPAAGPTSSITAPGHGYHAFLQLTLTVTDNQGLSSMQTVDLRPRVSSVTLQTSPPGIGVSIGDTTGPSPTTSAFLENGAVQLVAPAGKTTYTAVYNGPPDTTPPVIRSASAGPPKLDPRTNGHVTVTASVTDDTGVSEVRTSMVGDDGIVHTADLAGQADGTWVATVDLPPTSRPGDYAVTVIADDAAGNTVSASAGSVKVVWADVAPPVLPDGFTPIAPQRLLDTRNGTGAPAIALTPNVPLRLQVAGVTGIPVGATGVAVNVTAVGSRGAGYVTAYPCGSAAPVVSTLNLQPGGTEANLAVVRLDTTGGICFVSSQHTDLVVDASAVVVPGGDGYAGISPVRVVDTRNGTGLAAGLITPGQIVQIPLDAASAPADASAVVANVTVTEPSGAGYLTVFPCAQGAPLASNVNFSAGQTVSNLVMVGLDVHRQLCATTNATLHLVVDVSGWVTKIGGAPVQVTPFRTLDTRTTVPLAAGQTVRLDASAMGAPSGATALIANITAVDTAAAGYVTVVPCEAGTPPVSNVNFAASDTRPVLTMTTLGASRMVCVHTSQPIDLLVDVQGWIVAAPK
jgi:glucose/arabinose dehydrogenase